MTKLYFILVIIVPIFFLSCNKFTEDQGVPSFIHIDKLSLNAGVGQGTDSAKISDAWIYVDDAFLGVYELPVTFPILKSGKTNLVVKPGVILNGISATRSVYPYFKPLSYQVDLVKDSTITLTGLTTYTSESVFPWNSVGQEDFEQGGISIDTLSSSTAALVKSKLDVYEGDYSGLVHMDSDHSIFFAHSVTDFSIPSNKSGLILEMNCKNPDNIIVVGVFFNLSGGTVAKEEYLFINPGSDWKKLYVNLTSLLSTYSTALSYKIFFSASLPSGATSADFYLDNIKLVHF